MIRANEAKNISQNEKKEKQKQKVKIAILDSGIDDGNDIELAATISLVPGEEEMNPLFMDGTGHGNSVAGLIAATDNNKGITGINPNVEIYSIRVLDNENRAPISRVIEGIYMAIEKKVNIINMSFGVSQYSVAFEKAIKDAYDAGILIIASAGNTGEKGVQYPAAFDEVMAVGAVDQHGDVVENSAQGQEVEIVAPGEMVCTTGEFGLEVVESGTSLSAPQVAAVASLIWEKDLDVSADFVRALINESANQYGERRKYGNGLVDAKYALKNYHEFKKQYAESRNNATIEENKTQVLSFEEINFVDASWSKDNHASMVSGHKNVKKGARYPDINSNLVQMKKNPWWHGYYQTKAGAENNYVATYIYMTRIANTKKYGGAASIPAGLSATIATKMKNDLNNISLSEIADELGKDKFSVTGGDLRAFYWGMAVHNLGDSYAHSAYVKDSKGKWWHLKHNYPQNEGYPEDYLCADSISGDYKKRFNHASESVALSIKKYDMASHPSGSFKEFEPVWKANKYRLANLHKYIKQTSGSQIYANQYSSVSLTVACVAE